MEEYKVNIPEEFENMTVMTTVFSPVVEDFGVLIMGENIEKQVGPPVIRVYYLEKRNGTFECIEELESFAFESVDQAVQFSGFLPEMSGIEMLLMLHRNERMRGFQEGALYQW